MDAKPPFLRRGPLLQTSPRQVVPIASDSHHKRQRIRSWSSSCRNHCHRSQAHCRIQAGPGTTTSLSFQRQRPYLSAAPSAAMNCTRSCLLPKPRSTRWSSAANSPDVSGSPSAASYGISTKSRLGSKNGSKPHDQCSPAHLLAQMSGGASIGRSGKRRIRDSSNIKAPLSLQAACRVTLRPHARLLIS